MEKVIRLYDLPPRPENPIRIYGLSGNGGKIVVLYHHIDGMYSYCTVEDDKSNDLGHTHLSVSTPLVKHKDGYKVAPEPVDHIKILMETQLTEKELIIFLLVENGGMSYRTIAEMLLTNHTNIRRAYESAKDKMNRFADAGLLSTPIQKKD